MFHHQDLLAMSLLMHLHSVYDRGMADSNAEGKLSLRDSLAVQRADSTKACRWETGPASTA